MNQGDEKRLLVKIAQMYYEHDMTQSDISKALNIYRTSVSRLLKKAREEGIVKITIDNELAGQINLETELEKAFGLKEAIVIPVQPGQTDQEKKSLIAKAGAELLKRTVKDNDVVGFAWGSTLAEMVGELHNCPKRDAYFVPLVGGPGTMDTKYHVNTIVYNIANDFGGTAQFIDASAVVERKETKQDIVQSHYFSKISDFWRKLSVAVVGIGAPIKSSNMIWTGFYGDKDINDLNELEAIGDICSRFYDRDGVLVDSELSDRTIAIELEQLKQTRYTIGIAESIEKVPSILGALKGGYMNCFITTDETAHSLLKEPRL
ncbi:sugar-binding transcriptional regulator [Bacillus nakamurai]|uniref:sugar-binding transcriptional regulator n=1 Tax=Bacillus nakamurai TaxID=1793963 RepID=UPI0020C5A8F8|nr:sugar-binding transcriptional regulator [Bacillus nakamurai]MCP6684059.1 sugar-binding transcriptional regulator [Bacillus nakamurai]